MHLGALGLTGLTAYFGLIDVGRPEPGETVVVSGAAGARVRLDRGPDRADQGAARRHRRRPGEVRWLAEEAGSTPRSTTGEDVRARLREHVPERVDVFFDNVGGEILDSVAARLARGARVVLCGAISRYDAAEPPPGPKNYMQLLVMRASMTGFVVFDYAQRYGEAVAGARRLAADGSAAIARGHRPGRHPSSSQRSC